MLTAALNDSEAPRVYPALDRWRATNLAERVVVALVGNNYVEQFPVVGYGGRDQTVSVHAVSMLRARVSVSVHVYVDCGGLHFVMQANRCHHE